MAPGRKRSDVTKLHAIILKVTLNNCPGFAESLDIPESSCFVRLFFEFLFVSHTGLCQRYIYFVCAFSVWIFDVKCSESHENSTIRDLFIIIIIIIQGCHFSGISLISGKNEVPVSGKHIRSAKKKRHVDTSTNLVKKSFFSWLQIAPN